ncbi:hypothetical protein LTR84_006581 [Exophiala bonariae]|uniref:FAD-binding domain-containing protein n=1 Tax=Exophiala bonariae TaxID=1690606 RepID=A0AAV9N0Q4_9EURO|nr:hypothetical protein LTR84_006581 [Exophiala bonariae]
MPLSPNPNDRDNGLQVLVVGGSIGGIATAIALKAQGHHVKIYEQANSHDIRGGGINVFPNALGALRNLGVDLDDIRATKVKKVTRFLVSEEGDSLVDSDTTLDKDACVWHNTTYRDLLEALRDRLQDPKAPGPRADIFTSQQIVRIDPKKGILFLADGSEARGHVIVGADGVHSMCRASVSHGNMQRFRLQKGVFRAVIPCERLLSEPKVSRFIQDSGQAFCYNLDHKSLLIWPASENENVCVKFLYDDLTGFKSLCKDWREPSSKMKLLRLAQGFPEECIALLNAISGDALQDQPIWDMDPLRQYHVNRLVLMGDAAHPMPPHCGQRVAMALEDAVALGVLLERNVPQDGVEDRFKLYSGTRSTRSSAVQQFIRGLNEADIWRGTGAFHGSAFRTYILGHDERLHMSRTLGIWKIQQAFQQDIPKQAVAQLRETPSPQQKPQDSKPVQRPALQQMGRSRSWLSRLKSPKPPAAITSS